MTDESACPKCQAATRFVLTEGNLRWRIDVEPDPDGTIVIVERSDGTRRARVLSGGQLPAQQEAFVGHERTCKAKPAQGGPRCTWCHLPMDAELARLEGWIEHPCCDFELRQMLAGWKRRTRRSAA